MARIAFDNSYARELPGLYVRWQPSAAPAPRLLYFNDALAAELGLDAEVLRGPDGAAFFAGNALPAGAEPIAQAYAGPQNSRLSETEGCPKSRAFNSRAPPVMASRNVPARLAARR